MVHKPVVGTRTGKGGGRWGCDALVPCVCEGGNLLKCPLYKC